jgi:hypothetical protein
MTGELSHRANNLLQDTRRVERGNEAAAALAASQIGNNGSRPLRGTQSLFCRPGLGSGDRDQQQKKSDRANCVEKILA